MADDWPAHAACKGLHSADEDADVMFPRSELSGPDLRRAKRVCGRCPVRPDCLDDALRRGEQFGVRGGLASPERAAHKAGAPIVRCARCTLPFADLDGRAVCRACGGRGKPAAGRKPRVEPPPPSDPRCGTRAGVSAHRRRKEPLCGPCRDTRNARDREAVQARKAARDAAGFATGIERRRALAAQLARLPVSTRQVAQRMGCTLKTARRYLRAAREALDAAA